MVTDAERIAALEARLDKLSELTLPLVLADLEAKAAPPEPEEPTTEEPATEPTDDDRVVEMMRQLADPNAYGDAAAFDEHMNRRFVPGAKPTPKPAGLDHLDAHLAAKVGLGDPPPAA